jgi:hypothetical protein
VDTIPRRIWSGVEALERVVATARYSEDFLAVFSIKYAAIYNERRKRVQSKVTYRGRASKSLA